MGKEWVGSATTLYSDHWTRLEVTGFIIGNNDVRMYIETDGIQAIPLTFYVDGAQMEKKAYSTTYCDGDQPGCRWNIMVSSSNSTRDVDTRMGGRWVSLAGPCRNSDDIYLTVLGGFGMPPLQHNIQSWAQTPGSFFQNTKILDRSVSMAFHIKNKDLRITHNPDASPLHKLRQQLIDIFKPDVTKDNEPFLFSYQEGEREIFLNMRYEAGLEGSWDIRNKWVDSMPIRFLVVDPMMFENNRNVYTLDIQDSTWFASIGSRVNGQWAPPLGFNETVLCLETGTKGEIYAGGTFTYCYNSVTPGDITPMVGIAYWNGSKWTALNTDANVWINSMSVSPTGTLYVTGLFGQIGGVAANNVAYYDGTWHAMGGGLDDAGNAIAVAPNGKVYVGGDFDSVDALDRFYIALWDGGSWQAMGAIGGFDAAVTCLEISKDGNTVFIGGKFSNENTGGLSLLKVCKYDVNTNLFSVMGSGFNANVWAIKLSPDGILYAGGEFTASGAVTENYIAYWNGTTWLPMGSGMTPVVGSGITTWVRGIDIGSNGEIISVGNFSSAGNVITERAAIWNGSTWVNIDINIPGADYFLSCIIINEKGDYYIGCGTNVGVGILNFSGMTVVTNTGSAESRPNVYIKGKGRLRRLENQTTKKILYFDLEILAGEEVFIDFGKLKMYSTVRGDLSYSILPGSDFADFSLIPGYNKIACFINDDVLAVAQISYQPQHWSADATVNAEALY